MPFVYRDILSSLDTHALILWITGLVIFVAALVDFEALRVGKISVVEPIYACEVGVTALLATFILRESLTLEQGLLVALSMVGIFLIAVKSFKHIKRIHAERGVWLAILATIGMGCANFLYGVGARETNPLMINWFANTFIAAACLIYLVLAGRMKEVSHDLKHHKRLIVNMSFFDNLAWITYSYSTVFIPIAVATAISEAYIVLASMLGVVYNKEHLKFHQIVGFVLTVGSVIILAVITDA